MHLLQNITDCTRIRGFQFDLPAAELMAATRPKRPASDVVKDELMAKKQKEGFDEVGSALKMLERPLLKRDPADEHRELVDAMNIWKEEAELGEEIQKRHAAKPKAVGRWNRKDRAEDEAELIRAAKAARVEVMEKEEEYEDEKEEDGKQAEEEYDDGGGGGGEEQLVGEGQEEERQEQDEEVNPEELEADGLQGDQDEVEDGHDDQKQQQGWWGHQGWWKRSWHKGKGKNYGSWQPRRKPHWASWKPPQRDFSGRAKGTGKGKFDKWGGEYCVGGYKDLAGNFYERL